MTCQTCNGSGHVTGHWMPELCPACAGSREIITHEPEDKSAYGVVFAIAGIALCLYAVATWGVWSLIWGAVA